MLHVTAVRGKTNAERLKEAAATYGALPTDAKDILRKEAVQEDVVSIKDLPLDQKRALSKKLKKEISILVRSIVRIM